MVYCGYCGYDVGKPCLTDKQALNCDESEAKMYGLEPDGTNISPEHYARWKIQPIEFVLANNMPFPEGSVIKYVCRHDHKNGAEDLLKAKRYIDMILEHKYNVKP